MGFGLEPGRTWKFGHLRLKLPKEKPIPNLHAWRHLEATL